MTWVGKLVSPSDCGEALIKRSSCVSLCQVQWLKEGDCKVFFRWVSEGFSGRRFRIQGPL